MDAITAEVIGPSGPVYLNFDVGPEGGKGFFQPDEVIKDQFETKETLQMTFL